MHQVLDPSSVLAVEAVGEHAYRSRPVPTAAERPGPDAGDGPWSIEYAVEVTPLEA